MKRFFIPVSYYQVGLIVFVLIAMIAIPFIISAQTPPYHIYNKLQTDSFLGAVILFECIMLLPLCIAIFGDWVRNK